MNRETLKNIFNAPYQTAVWKGFLKELFRDLDSNYFQTPVDLKDDHLMKHKDVEHIWEFGDITISDGKTIKFYEVVLKEDQQVTKNRVGLRNILSTELIAGYIDGAIITYHNHKAKDWRFTFISKSLYWDEENKEVKTETHPKRYTYLLGQNETVKTAVNQFEWLFKQIQSRGIKLEDILKAFSVEKLSKEFYAGYFHQYESFMGYIVDNDKAFTHFLKQVGSSNTPEDARKKAEHLVSDFVKKFLGRIVFLYFLQKKGWMGVPLDEDWGEGQRDFLQRLFTEFPDKNHFYEKVLVPLFFKTLNVNRSDNNDLFSVTNTRIPYLNGGLFEKDSTEPLDIMFEPQRFIDLFAFFDQYNFTVDESSPDDQDISVDPEMLGHIFENLLEDNKDKGAFYTPKEIVHYMTQESLIEYLHTHMPQLDKAVLTDFLKLKKKGSLSENELDDINALLNKVKICDPAIGSGAFPMGLLHEIFSLKGLIAFEQGYEAWSPARVKERIIENSIYGVDIEEGAVDIARLRFWLSLVVDEPTPRPLPNLDYKIICGNSLISRYKLDASIKEVFREFNKDRKAEDKIDLEKYKQLVKEYLHEADHDKKIAFKQLIEEVKSAFKTHLEKQDIAKISKARGELENLKRIDIFGNTVGSKKQISTTSKLLKNLEDERAKTLNGKIFENAIEWRFEFPNLLDADGNFEGFDIIIGNPPYIQLQKDDSYLAKLYEVFGFETFSRRGDIYTLFYEKSHSLLNESGIACFITSNKWMRAGYGKATRSFFLKNTSILKLIDFGDATIFKKATTYTNILIYSKDLENHLTQVLDLSNERKVEKNLSYFFNKNENKYSFEFSEEGFLILNTYDISIKDRIEEVGIPLKQWDNEISYGIKTGLNEAFIINTDTKNELVRQDPKNGEKIKPIYRGRDIKRYKAQWAGLWMIVTEYGSHKYLKNEYPGIYDFLEANKTQLQARGQCTNKGGKGQHHWLELDNNPSNDYLSKFEGEKILWAEIVFNSAFYFDLNGFYPEATAFVMTGKNLKYLVALLNSRLLTFSFKKFYAGGDLRGNTFRYKKAFLEQLPIIEPTSEVENVFDRLVEYISILSSNSVKLNSYVPNSHIIETFEEIIDAMVFELYFPDEFEAAGIHFMKYVERDFESIEGKNEDEGLKFIHESYQKLREKDNEIRNNLELMDIRLADIVRPIKNA